MGIRKKYRLHACRVCGELDQFAGFCNECGDRLMSIAVIPLDLVLEVRDKFLSNSSEIPSYYINEFVDRLLDDVHSG